MPAGFGPLGGGSSTSAGFYRVVRVGIHLVGITNGMVLSGHVSLNLEFGNTDPNGTLICPFLWDVNADANANGSSFPLPPDPAAASLSGDWDTTQVPNGSYTVQMGAILDDGTVYQDNPVTVTVYNLLCFPDPWNVGGDFIYVGAQTPYTDGTGTWQVDAYDEHGNYFGFLTGPIDQNGYFALPGGPGPGFSVLNTNSDGSRIFNNSVTLVFSADAAHPISPGPPWTFTNKTLIEFPWNFSPTAFTCVYMDVFGNSRPDAQNDALQMQQIIWLVEEGAGHPGTIGDDLNAFQVPLNGAWAAVLANGIQGFACRDFLWFGHGTPTTLGDATSGLLTAAQVAAALTNNSPNIVNRHPYRFVFLDGCHTAEGNWPLAFGIEKQKNQHIGDFLKRGIRPRAFVGWNRAKPIGWLLQGTFNINHFNYISKFWQTWRGSNPTNGLPNTLVDSIAAAQASLPNGSQDGNGITVYGAQDLTIYK